jgi:NAD-dependent SIR2 family protein deacetylase
MENCKAQGCQQQHGEDWSLAGHPTHTISRCQACQTKKRRIFNKIMKNASLFFEKTLRYSKFSIFLTANCNVLVSCDLLLTFGQEEGAS